MHVAARFQEFNSEVGVIAAPSVEKVLNGKRGIVEGIKACVASKCVMSAVTLIYAAIDAVSGLTRPEAEVETNSEYFMEWSERYFLPLLSQAVTPAELWGARCGVVHTYSPESRVSRNRAGRTVVYKWRVGHRPNDPRLRALAQTSIVLEVEDLVEAFEGAAESFQKEIEADSALGARVAHHLKGLLCYEPWHPVPIVVGA